MKDDINIIRGQKDRNSKENPMVSLIIISADGGPTLGRTMDSVANQTFKDFEILVVDSALSDDELGKATEHAPDATVLQSRRNPGFCRAANAASAVARGRYLFFVQGGTRFNERCLGELVETIETEPDAGIVGPLLLNSDNSLHSLGMKIDQLGRPWANKVLFNVDTEIIDNIFYAPAEAMLINKQLFNVLGGFDEGYYSGLEDADICWRARLLGQKVAINPWSIAYTAGRGPERVSYLQYRNSLRMIIKNYGSLRAVSGSTRFVGTTITASFKSLLAANPGLFWKYWKALFWNLMMLPSSIRARRLVQSGRIEDDEFILRDLIVEEDDVDLTATDRVA